MRAAYVERFGPPEEIRFGELSCPRPGPTDVLVDVLATTVNPVDTFVRSGRFRTDVAFPFVVGRDLVGRVARAGEGAAGFAPGDLVWSNSLGHGGRQGAAAERAVVASDRLYHLPPEADPYEAVAVFHPAATAYLALFTHGNLRAGETVLVEGAAGNVGSALVTLAVRAGARVVATAAAKDAGHCRSLGAGQVLDYADPHLEQRIVQAAPHGVDLHLDTSGRNELERAVSLLAPRGRVVLLAGAGTRPVLPAGDLYMKDGSVRGFVISHATSAELAEAARVINGLLAANRLRPREVVSRPLASAGEAHRQMEEGMLRGRRVVLRTEMG
ncbi:NADPH:quinone reductase [Streptomyces sp. NPDC085927]|uniref:NADPH:quinone reductase n=1 Tax=Streptomyces sp. NPDC085927 TaxID=3365738 RepID=UPI0037D0AA3A